MIDIHKPLSRKDSGTMALNFLLVESFFLPMVGF
jgi:hypothetical protein